MRPGQQRPGNPSSSLGGDQPIRASMRPGQQRPGNHPPLGQIWIDISDASMRPGQQRPGNLDLDRVRPRRLCASMRPGQQRPGNRPRWPRPARPSACFNEAGATTPRKLGRLTSPTPTHQRASMRPGQQRPGNTREGRDHDGAQAASMRPGQQRPGNTAPRCGLAPASTSLQ